jgi:rod shape-determining protein MreC
MLRNRSTTTIFVVLLTGCLLLALPYGANSRIKLAVASFLLPVLALSEATLEQAEQLDYFGHSKQELWQENQQLRKELEFFKIKRFEHQALIRENRSLRDSLQWEAEQPWQMIAARVLVADPFNWWRSLYINLGSADGLVENTPVLSPQGLVGKVERVESGRSLVRIVGDPHCRVAAMLAEEGPTAPSRPALGTIMEGQQSAFNPRMVAFMHLPVDAQLQPGSLVVTSGMGGGFPRGIPVGRIVDSRPSESELFMEARVQLGIDPNQLDLVWLPLKQAGKESSDRP